MACIEVNGGGLVAKSCPILATPWTVARQAPLSMVFSRQEYWSGLPFPSPGDLPDLKKKKKIFFFKKVRAVNHHYPF